MGHLVSTSCNFCTKKTVESHLHLSRLVPPRAVFLVRLHVWVCVRVCMIRVGVCVYVCESYLYMHMMVWWTFVFCSDCASIWDVWERIIMGHCVSLWHVLWYGCYCMIWCMCMWDNMLHMIPIFGTPFACMLHVIGCGWFASLIFDN